MSAEAIIIILFAALIVHLFLGVPLAFSLGGTSVILMLLLWGPSFLTSVITIILKTSSDFLLIAIPLFILMGSMMESSGIAEDLYGAFNAWLGGIRGGLAMGTVVICAIFAAMVGVCGAEIVVMGLVALPGMLKYKYDKGIVYGSICAAGSLGQLIPPSLLFIVYGAEAGVSVGNLFRGGLAAGLVLSGLFIIYIGIRASFQKDLCPVVPREERASLKEKFLYLKALGMPLALIFSVLGSIFMGIATPSEAAGVGAVGAVVCAALKGRLNQDTMKRAVVTTLRTNCMVLWVVFGSKCYATVLVAGNGIELIQEIFLGSTLGPMGILALMIGILVVLGMFFDPVSIIIITVPVFTPIIQTLGFNPVWVGVLFISILQTGYDSPPFGMSLFYLKGVAPPSTTIEEIYRAVIPFVLIEIFGVFLMVKFPFLIMWAVK